MRWEFSPDEFLFAWNEIGSDRIPAPLVVVPSVNWRDEWDEIVGDLRERLLVRDDPDLSAVLRLAADPDTAVTVIGTRNSAPIRLYCGLTHESSVVLAQLPDSDEEFGGNVVVRTGSPASIAAWVSRFAGDQRAGVAPPMTESVAALTTPAQAVGLDYGEVSLTDRVHDLLAAARSGQGHVEVIRGRHRSEDGPVHRYLSWFDVVDDGRYAYRYQHGDLMVEPCSTARFEKAVSRMVGVR
ncbi:ESX secretion-associated protein EspG [Nocardia sp. NPDC058658]|uniref:ESX secretion-associated protein EspG n=1 Tax=Nocardia sp. NPDC058658 TaxID=3346580 RepID=UPI003647D345